jgi:hypothetical protein
MIARLVLGLLLLFCVESATLAQQDAAEARKANSTIGSVYASLTKCKLIFFRAEGGRSVQFCQGIAGYTLPLKPMTKGCRLRWLAKRIGATRWIFGI